ncbi:MAG: acyl-CoA dehydrogenase family protein [Hyphomonadaceae bacterium]|nr:acyl-CoA dehydrogenase family protein [Hyphomonadaceae bacterium]
MSGEAAQARAPDGAAITRLRGEVRDFIRGELGAPRLTRRVNSWAVADRDFSRALGRSGYIGMTWPRIYGGGARHPLERYVVIEELLAAGAPVGMHWIADRQSGPLLLRFGSEAQRLSILSSIARGETYTCIGMSEPGSGSDLASVRTRAVREGGGWRISGQKVWTTNAHHAQYMIALVRTDPASQRQEGLSQFLIDLASPGVTVRPIVDLTGAAEFNEVFFDDVLVPAESLVGAEGEGWRQVISELSLERSGPERYLSSLALFLEFVRLCGAEPSQAAAQLIGELGADLMVLRRMSLGVATKLASGEDPALDAAIVKDLGNSYEQHVPNAIQALADIDWSSDADFVQGLALLLQAAPSFSLRGGTREVLRGIIARGLGLR